MRPISSAFTDSTNALATKKSPVELDFVPSGKPSLVLSVVDVKVNQLLNNERSYVFHWLDTTYYKRPPNPKTRFTFASLRFHVLIMLNCKCLDIDSYYIY